MSQSALFDAGALRAGMKLLLLISLGALFVLDPGLLTFAWAPIIPGVLILLADD
jgi:hypothetical protein